jgi:transposase-like protein
MSADSNDGRKKRRFLSPEKKYQIFLEAQRSDVAVAEILRREGLYATDLARIRQKVKEVPLSVWPLDRGPGKRPWPRKSMKR